MDGLALAVTNTGRIAAATAYDPRFCLFEPDGARGVARCGHPGDGREVAFSEDGRRLAVGGEGGTITLWDPDRPSRPRLTLYVLPDGGWMSAAPGGAWIGEGVAGYLDERTGAMDPRGVARALRGR